MNAYITVHGMHHITGITEQPLNNSLWIVGFNMGDIPENPNPYAEPFYHAYIAEAPSGSNETQAVSLSGGHDLALPLSVVWTTPPEPPAECGNVDINSDGRVDFEDFAVLALYWLIADCNGSDNCLRADINCDNFIDIEDMTILAENWLASSFCNRADINNDRVVNSIDFASIAKYWLVDDCSLFNNCEGADIDGNNTINLNDIAILAQYWLEPNCTVP